MIKKKYLCTGTVHNIFLSWPKTNSHQCIALSFFVYNCIVDKIMQHCTGKKWYLAIIGLRPVSV